MTRMSLPFAVALLAAAMNPALAAEPETEAALPAAPTTTEFIAPDPAPEGFFGFDVAIDQGRLLVGAKQQDLVVPEPGGTARYYNVGAAYLFTWNGAAWDQDEFRASDWDESYTGKQFGNAVDLEGDRMVVGSWLGLGDLDRTGAAYVYTRTANTWSETILTASDGGAFSFDWFGYDVALSGSRVAVGAPTSDGDNGAGQFYLYEEAGGVWGETILTASNALSGDQLGRSVDISGNVAIVGAPQQECVYCSGPGGRAYVFTKAAGQWTEQALVPTGVGAKDAFGWAVAIDGGRIVVGAPGDDERAVDAGAAYVFEKQGNGNWIQVAKITADDATFEDTFGQSVAVSDDRIAIGAPRGEKAYLFTGSGDTWEGNESIPDRDGAQFDSSPNFGRSVGVEDTKVVVGAPFFNASNGGVPQEDAGAAYFYEYHACQGKMATLVGTPGPDTLVGTAGDDVIVGLAGNDVIDGGDGADTVCAGSGADVVNGGNGSDLLLGQDDGDTMSGGGGNDTVYGQGGSDFLYGGIGNDRLYGAYGHDYLSDWSGNDIAVGSYGNDTFVSGPGDDTYKGGTGVDRVDFSSAPAAIDLNLGAGTATGHGSDVLFAVENAVGSTYSDTLVGSFVANVVSGGRGSDTIRGLAGNDTINGNGGNDYLYGVTGDDWLRGHTGNDRLFGWSGNDVLNGGPGTDWLYGGTGADDCYGGETLDSC